MTLFWREKFNEGVFPYNNVKKKKYIIFNFWREKSVKCFLFLIFRLIKGFGGWKWGYLVFRNREKNHK
jgi:hypothetical protein